MKLITYVTPRGHIFERSLPLYITEYWDLTWTRINNCEICGEDHIVLRYTTKLTKITLRIDE